jgi:hypothetical protein
MARMQAEHFKLWNGQEYPRPQDDFVAQVKSRPFYFKFMLGLAIERYFQCLALKAVSSLDCQEFGKINR